MSFCQPVQSPRDVAFISPTYAPSSRRLAESSYRTVSAFPSSYVPTPTKANEHSTHKKSSPSSSTSGTRSMIKTELCKNFMAGMQCPYGKRCNYAHGVHELRMTKLKERSDADVYRTKPCPIFVSTGSCPFEDRCTCLHAPRVAGKKYRWMFKVYEYPTRHLLPSTDVHIDSFYYKDLSMIHEGHPFGNEVSITSWYDFYKSCCSIADDGAKDSNGRSTNAISSSTTISIRPLPFPSRALVLRTKWN